MAVQTMEPISTEVKESKKGDGKMVVQTMGLMGRETLDKYITQAAKAADYEDGFGIAGCDLSRPKWWASYSLQGEEEQSPISRLQENLRSCALEAKRWKVVVPREYILYDLTTGEHPERPGIINLRELMAGLHISGVILRSTNNKNSRFNPNNGKDPFWEHKINGGLQEIERRQPVFAYRAKRSNILTAAFKRIFAPAF